MTWLDIAKRLFRASSHDAAYAAFNTGVFLDTNIILEGKPLTDLPWGDIDPTGPILVLLTPTVLAEVDSKKHDGRLGIRAREFNRLIGPVASTGQPLTLLSGPPAVTLALATCDQIPWGKYDDLDPQDADSKVIAEVLHARGVLLGQRVVVSHDIKPIFMATRHGLRTLHVSDDWIRPAEPSRLDREVQRLKAQLSELQKTEPDLHFEIKPLTALPADAYRVPPLSQVEQDKLLNGIFRRNPPPKREPFGLGLEFLADSTLHDRYETYRQKTVPAFVATYTSKLEIQYGQVPIELVVSNRGSVRADNLVVRITVSTGWLNARAVFIQIGGPHAPRERPPLIPGFPHIVPVQPPGKHEMHLAIEPERSKVMEVHCEDFRNGETWTFKGVLWLDPTDAADSVVSVKATAANKHGEVGTEVAIPKIVRSLDAKELVDLDSGHALQKPRVQSWLEESISNKNFDRIEWDRNGDEDDY